ncbi:hypothetical protein OUZ56_007358 [Daphnia magna]|uniref:Uncharacterized protein n=1 Tax=Daphnia magna TaxID=35525 RepID=A0ABR0A9W8_9CRUS|nr:hypothetical protein OUZ56_007358 [Daphnia magna]
MAPAIKEKAWSSFQIETLVDEYIARKGVILGALRLGITKEHKKKAWTEIVEAIEQACPDEKIALCVTNPLKDLFMEMGPSNSYVSAIDTPYYTSKICYLSKASLNLDLQERICDRKIFHTEHLKHLLHILTPMADLSSTHFPQLIGTCHWHKIEGIQVFVQ